MYKNIMLNNCLFSKDDLDAMTIPATNDNFFITPNHLGTLNFEICQKLTFTGRFQMPVVQPITCNIPKKIIAFYRTPSIRCYDYAAHFYTDDKHFEQLWNKPYQMMNRLRTSKIQLFIGPDFSVYNELLLPQQLWNIFRNKLLVAFWQYWGIPVVPNISWVNCEQEASIDGWPKHSIIAVNSTGLGRNAKCKKMWINGYHYMIDHLEPIHIIRYGAKQEGEIESISTYFPNDNSKEGRYGR